MRPHRAHRLAAAALATFSVLVAGPADAAGGRVLVSYLTHAVPVGTGYLVAVVCEATADSGTSGDNALATTVRCGVNGVYDEVTVVGGKAVNYMISAAVPPLFACFGATATFVQPNGATYNATHPDTCVRI